jgi:hypothetical protein
MRPSPSVQTMASIADSVRERRRCSLSRSARSVRRSSSSSDDQGREVGERAPVVVGEPERAGDGVDDAQVPTTCPRGVRSGAPA